ncbi:MAG: sigma-54-dependent Fis family transcriptional regulator, partial [Deltaproteobacteria bacterium]|nr:sigma-54-dependent Fis family transcriptional regulator [Deltaproteobacteria bacterium]
FIKEDWLSCHRGGKMKPLKLDEMTSTYIKKILESTNGKISGPGGAAELLGIHPNTLRNKMGKLGIAYKRQ